MDVASLAAAFVTMQAGALQQQIAARMTKASLNSEAQVLQLLQPAPQAALAPGIGGAVDISA